MKLILTYTIYCKERQFTLLIHFADYKHKLPQVTINDIQYVKIGFIPYMYCSSRHAYETFLRYVLRYFLRNNFWKKLGTSHDELKTHIGMYLYDIYRISKLWCPNNFRTFLFYGFSWFKKALRNRLTNKMCPKTVSNPTVDMGAGLSDETI
jgi:hypothetical protein